MFIFQLLLPEANTDQPFIHYHPSPNGLEDRANAEMVVIPQGGEMGPKQLKGLSQIFAHIPEAKRPDRGLALVSNAEYKSNYAQVNVQTGEYVVTYKIPCKGPDGKPIRGQYTYRKDAPPLDENRVKAATGSKTLK